jgi:hypothetical protein
MYIVIDPDNGHFVRHMQFCSPAGVQDFVPTVVMTGHDAYGLRQFLQPTNYLLLLLFPALRTTCFGLAYEHVTAAARLLHQLDKKIAAAILIWVFSSGRSAKCEMTQSTILEMLKGKLRDRVIIHSDERQVQIHKRPSQVDGRDAGIQDGIRHALIVDARQNPVTPPVLEPNRGWVTQSMGLEKD